VRFLATTHSYGIDNVSKVERRRLRPYNSFLKELVIRVWGNKARKKLTLLRLLIDYNN
jgi:hypothetical protein